MKENRQPNVGASVRARLLRLARERGDDFQLLMTRYANERFLYRLSQSEFAERFVLKGATLFMLWTGAPHRATRDVDLLGFGEASEERIRNVFTELLTLDVPDDGVQFDLDTLSVGPIREDQAYGGLRAVFVAKITSAKVKLQVDVGFGDAITPAAEVLPYPKLLNFPAPELRAYPRETVIAEKLEAMVQLGMNNSRMKDFYDIVVLARIFDFDGELLVQAIRATFERRKMPLPEKLPVAMTSEFAGDSTKTAQWRAFKRKAGVLDVDSLEAVVSEVSKFASPPLMATHAQRNFKLTWKAGGSWSSED